MSDYRYTCLICGKGFNKIAHHVMYTHKMKPEDYFLQFNKDKSQGKCRHCGKPTFFLGITKGYRKHCSTRCSTLNIETKEKFSRTLKERYGVSHNWENGVLRDKVKKVMLEKYGVSHNWNSGKLRQKNGTISSQEKIIADVLDNNEIPYIHNAFIPLINSNIDFFIPSYNLILEINVFYTHGRHPFDNNSENDLKALEKIKQKALTSLGYQRYIEVWTKEDVFKRETLEKSSYNFIAFYGRKITDYHIQELIKNIEKLKNGKKVFNIVKVERCK